MSTTTENLGLVLPEAEEYFELDTWTGNCRKLDAGYGTTQQTIANDVAAAMHRYAEEGGTIHDIDTGFITTLKEIHNGAGFKVWLGTTAEYNVLEAGNALEPNTLYIRTDDTSASDIREMLENHFMLIMANANEINDLLTATADSGWTPLTISGTGFAAGSAAPQYRKIGSRVYLRGQIVVDMDNVVDVTTVFATLPEGFRPSAAKYQLLAGEGDRMARLYIRTGGGININYFKEYAGATVTGSHWLQLDCEFLTD